MSEGRLWLLQLQANGMVNGKGAATKRRPARKWERLGEGCTACLSGRAQAPSRSILSSACLTSARL